MKHSENGTLLARTLLGTLGLLLCPWTWAGTPDAAPRISPAPRTAKFADADYFVWGASMVRDPQGLCHLLYSRWPRSKGFAAWVSDSEIAHAVAAEPLGPYTHVDVALPKRGVEHWDGLCAHNPTVHAFDGKYYLYYMGNTTGARSTEDAWWNHRNHQRIGVAVADHPSGPWQRFDTPLIDVAKDGAGPDALMTSNPSICRRTDGTYVLVYKAVGLESPRPFGGPVVHMAATSRSPIGPFLKHESPIFTSPGEQFPAEDPSIWVQDGVLWAILKDMKGAFTQGGHVPGPLQVQGRPSVGACHKPTGVPAPDCVG